MKLQISKWGNSLAIRLPASMMRTIGAKAGDDLEAQIDPLGNITLTPARSWDKAAFLERMRKMREEMPMTSPTVAEMRKNERY